MELTFGERIAVLRKRAGLSQSSLGEQTGMSEYSICRIEKNTTKPGPQQLSKLCAVLEADATELLRDLPPAPAAKEG